MLLSSNDSPSYKWLGIKNNNQKTSYLPASHDFIHVKPYLDEFLKNGVSSLLLACQGRLIAYLCRHNQTGNLPTQYHERLGLVAALTQCGCTLHHLNILPFFSFSLLCICLHSELKAVPVFEKQHSDVTPLTNTGVTTLHKKIPLSLAFFFQFQNLTPYPLPFPCCMDSSKSLWLWCYGED